MTNLKKRCLIASTDGIKNENGCVRNEKTPLALICQNRLQAESIVVSTRRFSLSVEQAMVLNFEHLTASLTRFNI